MTQRHTPDPEFLAHLRWQVESEARRRARFGSAPAARAPRLARWKAAALLAAGLSLGTAGTVAAGEIGRRQDRTELLAEIAIELQLAQTEVQLMSTEQERMERLAQAGVVNSTELARARQEAIEAVTRLQVLDLQRTEIRIGGEAPVRNLAAPLVRGRDFVTEELVLRRTPLLHRIELLERELERTSVRAEAGIVPRTELRGAELEVHLANTELEGFTARADLRARYLKGQLTPTGVALASRVQEARLDRKRLALRLRHAHMLAEIRTSRQASGFAGPDPRAELDLARLEAEFQLANLRLETLLKEAQGLPADLLGTRASKNEPSEPAQPKDDKR